MTTERDYANLLCGQAPGTLGNADPPDVRNRVTLYVAVAETQPVGMSMDQLA